MQESISTSSWIGQYSIFLTKLQNYYTIWRRPTRVYDAHWTKYDTTNSIQKQCASLLSTNLILMELWKKSSVLFSYLQTQL